MARKKREKSPTGIYHVMLRGINKQEIFFKEDDVLRMMRILRDIQVKVDPITKNVVSDGQCTLYAYCIMKNHLHLLFKEGELGLSEAVKRIEDSYAVYYNLKYTRVGHLFQGRFASEAVKDELYFRTVLRYIALNPVKAFGCKAEEYQFGSWNEYVGHKSNLFPVLKRSAIDEVVSRYPLKELRRWVAQKNDDRCLDMDDDTERLSDSEAVEVIVDKTGVDHVEYFRQLDAETQIFHLLRVVEETGMSLKQASRVGSVTYAQLKYAYQKQKTRNYSPAGSDPKGEKSEEMKGGLEEVKRAVGEVHGFTKRSYGQLLRIVEYLYEYPGMKCTDIATAMGMDSEACRRKLIRLANEGLVVVNGERRAHTYSLK